jgi:hypothetical protein
LPSWRNIPDEYVLKHQYLDGYIYLRFLKMLTLICFVGACVTFSVLFPVNATGHGMQSQFDLHSFSNINKDYPGEKNRYYAHVFIGWVFFSEWTKLRIPSHADQFRFCYVAHHLRDNLLHQSAPCIPPCPLQCRQNILKYLSIHRCTS